MRVVYDESGQLIDFLDLLQQVTGNKRRAKTVYDASDIEVDKDGYADWKDVCDELERLAPKYHKALKALEEIRGEDYDVFEDEEEVIPDKKDRRKRDRDDEEEEPLVDDEEYHEVPRDDIELTCRVMDTLTNAYQTFAEHDKSIGERLLMLAANQLGNLEEYCNKTAEDVAPALNVTKRSGYDEVMQKDLFEIGKRAKSLYYQRYGRYPRKIPRVIDGKVRFVNKYTEATAPYTLDVAIDEVLNQ